MLREAEGSRGRGGVYVSGSFHIRNRGGLDEMVSGFEGKRGRREGLFWLYFGIFCAISSLVKVGDHLNRA